MTKINNRFIALDTFRGATIALMIIVITLAHGVMFMPRFVMHNGMDVL